MAFKILIITLFAIFLYFGFDMRKRSNWKAMSAVPLTAVMKLFSLTLAVVFLSVVVHSEQALPTDWVTLALLAVGAFIVRAAKKQLITHGAFTWTGYVLEKPRLVTSGVYSLVRHPLYVGVFLTTASGLIYVLPRVFIWLPGHAPLLSAFMLSGAAYAVFFNWKMACKESNYLKTVFGASYVQYADKVNAFIPSFRVEGIYVSVLIRDFKNLFARKLLNLVSHNEFVKKSFSHFYAAKFRRNADLQKAAEGFNLAYNQRLQEGSLVNDIRIVRKESIWVEAQTPKGGVFKALNLATNSYNDLDLEEDCRSELVKYVANEDLSSCLSRKIAGQLPVHAHLENEICDFLGYKSCVLATSGYIAQQAVLFGLFGEDDIIFSDEHNHSSLVDGMRLSKAKVIVYPHLDYQALEKLMKKHRLRYNAAGIVSDGVFSAHGTMAHLEQIHTLKLKYNAISVIDDTHGFVVSGSKGRGVLDYFATKPDVLTASLAKGLAAFGGMIVANQSLARVIDCLGRQNINTSHLSPLTTAQALINLQFYRKNLKRLTCELHTKISYFNERLKELEIHAYEEAERYVHPIFSFYGDSEIEVSEIYRILLKSGFMGAFFPPPVSPLPTIRFSLHRNVPFEDLKMLAILLKENNLNPLSTCYWSKMRGAKPQIATHESFELPAKPSLQGSWVTEYC